jgi:enoyl-CoA hydratase/carnithine racemase
MDTLLIDHGNWAELVLNRPERKNAITGPLGQDLTRCLAEIEASDTIQVVLLRGEGGAFCSGLDLKEFNADPAPDWLENFQLIWRGAHRALFNCSKPIVGALERYAINGGAALALACDLLIVGRNAFLQVGEVQLGMAAPYNLAWLALRHPETTSAKLAMIGRRHTGEELVALGIALENTEDDQVVTSAETLCTTLAEYPVGAGDRIKAGIRARLEMDADAWFDRFTRTQKAAAPPSKVT